jgi:protein O-GlcNAc transferase
VATVAEVFSQAWNYHQAGGFPQAEQLYRHILQADPRHADAWCFLGAACQAQGKLRDAEANYREAVLVLPNHTSALNCLGVLLAQQGRLAEANASFRQALQFDPSSAEIHNNLGLTLARQGKTSEAAESYQKALLLKPDYVQVYYNHGLMLNGLGQHEAAIQQFQHALRLQPNYPEALNDLGNALGGQGKLDDAVSSYQQALRQRPNYAEAHYNLGVVLGKQEKHKAALVHYQQAVHYKPDYAEAHMNLGNVLHGLWEFDDAIACYQRAVQFRPDYADAFHGLGGVFLRLGRLAEAVAAFQEARRLQPEQSVLHSNILFCLNYDPDVNPDTIFAAHRQFGQVSEAKRQISVNHHVPIYDLEPERCLRIGYVSPDFRYHALTRYFEPVMAHHDPRQLEIFCYAEVPVPDVVTSRLQSLAKGWRRTCGQTDEQMVEQIRQDRIDILVDLAGHTANNRLGVFAHKPAPIQATWLGYMNTTGLTTVDYRLTDDVLDPPGEPVRDTEQLFRLPRGMCCFAAPDDAPAVTPLPAFARGHLTFGSLHNLFKLNSRVFDLWSQLLKALPKSRLLMFRHTLTGSARDDLRRQFVERGVGSDQLDLRQGSDAAGYLGIYAEIDIGLDSFPYTGGVTTCESLWMGVPVLSLRGVRPAGRNSAAILTRVGLGDWAVESADEYIAFAIRQADQLDQLAELRAGLRERMATTLCDAASFTRSLEECYRTMWRRWVGQQSQP